MKFLSDAQMEEGGKKIYIESEGGGIGGGKMGRKKGRERKYERKRSGR